MTTSSSALRKRNMTAARRSLTLIRDAVLTHLDILDEGKVPESSFTASVFKYEAALNVLRTLDALGGSSDGKGWLATVEVSRDDLDVLVGVLRQSDLAIAIEQADEGSPLGNILAVLGTGEPADQPS